MIAAWVQVRNGENRSVVEGAQGAALIAMGNADYQGDWGR